MKFKPLSKKIKEKLQESISRDIGTKDKTVLEDLLKVGGDTLSYQQKRTIESTIAKKQYVPRTDEVKINSRWINGKWSTAEYKEFRRKQIDRVTIKTFMEKILIKVRQEIEDEVFDAILDTGDELKAIKFVVQKQLAKIEKTW